MAEEKVKDNRKEKKKKEPGKVRRWFKDFFSELKKVTWPSFSKVVKQTGIVLLVTICFLLVMMAFDAILGLFYRDFLIKGLSDSVSALSTFKLGAGGLL